MTGNHRKVVARYVDGRLVKGYTFDFAPSQPRFHVFSQPTASGASAGSSCGTSRRSSSSVTSSGILPDRIARNSPRARQRDPTSRSGSEMAR